MQDETPMQIDLQSELSKKIIHHRHSLSIKSMHKIANALGVDPIIVAETLHQFRIASNPSSAAPPKPNREFDASRHSTAFIIKKGQRPNIPSLKPKLPPFPFEQMDLWDHFELISVAEFNRCNKAVQQLRKNGYDRMFKVSQKEMKCWRIR